MHGRFATCQQHYGASVAIHANRLGNEEDKETFKTLAMSMKDSLTPDEYACVYAKLEKFIAGSDNRKRILCHWLQWWHQRRGHVFNAFRPLHATPSNNLAEVKHASWVACESINLTLVDAAQYDSIDSLTLEVRIESLAKGDRAGMGYGPSFAKRLAKEHKKQLSRAQAYAKEANEYISQKKKPTSRAEASTSANRDFKYDPQSTHRPDKTTQDAHGNKHKRPLNEEKRKGSKRLKGNRYFRKALEKAKNSKMSLMKHSNTHRVYTVVSEKNTYTVSISNVPTCTCGYYLNEKNMSRQICKHIIWVYLNVLGVNEACPYLYQTALLVKELNEMFQKAPDMIPEELKQHRNARDITKDADDLEPIEIDAILRSHPHYNDANIWYVDRLIRDTTAKCAGCRASNMIEGRLYVYVNALNVPPRCTHAVDRK